MDRWERFSYWIVILILICTVELLKSECNRWAMMTTDLEQYLLQDQPENEQAPADPVLERI